MDKETKDKIGSLLCDKTTGQLKKDGQILNDDEELGSLVTLTYLGKMIMPLLDEA